MLHISLARFNCPDSQVDTAGQATATAHVLAGKILNQLIHQLDANKIP